MKKNNYLVFMTISLVLTASFLGCQKEVAVTSVELYTSSLALLVGESRTLSTNVSPKTATNKEVIWSSTQTDVASVNAAGIISAKAGGTTTITATTIDGGFSASCHVTVITEIAITSIELDKSLLTLLVGESETLLATVAPKTATNKDIIWSSTDTDVASIDAAGTISAKATGTTTITVTAIGGSFSASCRLTVATTVLWGLGENITDAQSNNVSYEWYIDQGNTGVYSSANCGPSSVTMAIKWSNQNFTKTAEDARNTYQPDGGWWYTYDIINYLTNNQTPHYVAQILNASHLTSQLDNGNIAILCLDMYYVRHNSLADHEWRIDKFYYTGSPKAGHFIVVKGYKIVDGIIWFEVYDPWSTGQKYIDGSLKGRNRYYRAEDIILATSVWWKFMIVINNPTATRTKAMEIDPSTIVHQWGG
jgi:Bacterial surface proteins containing Ig-like domains